MAQGGFGPRFPSPRFKYENPEEAFSAARRAIVNNALRRQQRSLDLSSYGMERLPSEIGKLESLQVLILTGNRLKTLPRDIRNLENLVELQLDENDLEQLPSEIGQLGSLRLLDCSGNRLRSLPLEISLLGRLEELVVSNNQLRSLPPEISRLENLESLFLEENELQGLPPEIGRLLKLNLLNVDNNQLLALPSEIGQLVALESLLIENNFLSSLPSTMGQLTNLSDLDLRKNRLTSLPPEIGEIRSLEDAAVRAFPLENGLLLDRNPLDHPYSTLIADGQPSATRNVLMWLRGEIDLSSLPGLVASQDSNFVPPPTLPKQGHGPHFEINDRGVISFAPPQSLDRQGNNVDRLRNLHPSLKLLSTHLASSLGAGNTPHWYLRGRAAAYSKLIDRPLDDVDFNLLYVEGVRLANADAATKAKILEGELPPLDTEVQETVESLLQLHGTFILATSSGMELLADEQRFQRNPQEEAEYRSAAMDFARSLQDRPDIIDQKAASFILDATEEIGKGANLERSGVVADATIKNVAITVSTAAVLAALSAGAVASGSPALMVGAGATMLVAGEGLKRSKAFAVVASLVTRSLDKASDVEIANFFDRFAVRSKAPLNFVISLDLQLRRLASKGKGLAWLNQTLDWVKEQADRNKKIP